MKHSKPLLLAVSCLLRDSLATKGGVRATSEEAQTVDSSADANARRRLVVETYPSTAESEKFLLIGVGDGEDGQQINLSNGEYGADLQVLSESSYLDLKDVFDDHNWLTTGCDGQEECLHFTVNGEDHICAPPQGIDWSGNIATTFEGSKLGFSNIDIYGGDVGYGSDIMILTDSNDELVGSNDRVFPVGSTSSIGSIPSKGTRKNVDMSGLRDEIDEWSSAIPGFTKEGEMDGGYNPKDRYTDVFVIELRKQGTSATPGVDESFEDVNGDGVVIIDVKQTGHDYWEIENSDVVIIGDESLTAIFRIRGDERRFKPNNGSLMRCGANAKAVMVAVGMDWGSNSQGVNSMEGSNAVLQNIAVWEIKNGAPANNNNEYDNVNACQNCQGCAQFVGDKIEHSNNRWMRCAFGLPSGQCTDDRAGFTNPSCPDADVARYLSPADSSDTPPDNLLYDFSFHSDEISFKVWHDIGQDDTTDVDVYVQYREVLGDGSPGDIVCTKAEPSCIPDGDASTPTTVSASCSMDNRSIVTVSYVLRGANDQSFDPSTGTIDECCHAEPGTNPVVHYSYVLECGCPTVS